MTAKEESIQNILEMAEYKKSGQVKALIVTGCLAQRYRQEILDEIPEVDEVLGTTAYDKILDAVDVHWKESRALYFRILMRFRFQEQSVL